MIVYLVVAPLFQILMWVLGQGFVLPIFTLGWLMADAWLMYINRLRDDSLLSNLIILIRYVVSYIKRIKFR